LPDPARPLIILHSPSYVLKRRELERRLAALLPAAEDREFGVEQFWAGRGADKLDEMVASIPMVSLLAPDRVVILHELQLIGAREQKPLVPALERIPGGTTVIITTSPKSDRDKKPPLSADLLKLAQKIGEVWQPQPPRERELPDWVVEEARKAGKQITRPDAQVLVETCGGELDKLINELAKLAIYVGNNPFITAADIAAAAAPLDDRDIFALVDAIGHRNAPAAVDIIRALMPPGTKRGEGLGILGMITRQVRLLWQAVYATRQGESTASLSEATTAILPEDTSLAGAHSFVKQKLAAQAANFSEAQLARALVRLYETDLAFKGQGEGKANERTVLEALVVSLCRR
jgi:DNA polymerase III subunit delta